MSRLLLLAFCASVLAGCGETDQAKTGSGVNRGDEPAWKGAKNAHVAKNWKPGDRSAWEGQIRARGQQQNEYVKTN